MDDLTAQLNIARTERRIAILCNLIEKLGAKGKAVSEHRRMLAAEERCLASGCAPPETPEAAASTTGTAVGYITPPSAND